jgi:hypothetical protein
MQLAIPSCALSLPEGWLSDPAEFPVRRFIPIRVTLALLVASTFALTLPQWVSAQDDPNDMPLGDVARSFRRKPASPEVVIDNDNFSKVVDDAESRRASGSTMVFSFDPGGKSFQVSSPDVSCSLSFTAKSSSLLSDPLMLDELPRSELAKLDGPAMIDGDSLQVSMHNGTAWELREVVIGLTIVRRPEHGDTASYYGQARIVPAVAGSSSHPVQDPLQKQPDVTMLLRVKGSAAPSATALFRAQLNFALFPDQEWHWAIVRAKGVPPQTAPEATPMPSDLAPVQLPTAPAEAGPQSLPLIPVPPSTSSNPDAATH